MRGFWLIFLLFLTLKGFSQDSTFIKVSAVVDTIPKTYKSSYKVLARKLCDSLKGEEEKAKAIALWIIKNIDYDVKMYEKGNFKKQKSNEVLKKRKGICEGYSNLFKDMCEQVGVRTYVVTGYSKAGNFEPGDILVREDHAWNAVQIKGKWYLVDLTWAAGDIELKPRMFRRYLSIYLGFPFKEKRKYVRKPNYKYLFAEPSFLIVDHLPVNDWWQLMQHTVPVQIFEKDSAEIKKYIQEGKGPLSSFDKDIANYEEMDEPMRVLEKSKKAHQFNPKNFQTPAQGKLQHAVDVFRITYVRMIPNSKKIVIYDSCLIEIQACISDLDSYDKITVKERDVRIKKNEKYSAESLKLMDNLSKTNEKRKKMIGTQLSSIKSELIKLEQEENNLKLELVSISKKKTPETGKKFQEKKMSGILKKMSALNDNNIFLSEKISAEKSTDNANESKKTSAAAINTSTLLASTIFQKVMYRNFFNWHLKYYLDSLQKKENSLSTSCDSLIQIINKNYTAANSRNKNLLNFNSSLKKNSNSTFDLYKKLYESITDSVVNAHNYNEKFQELKNKVGTLNNERITEIASKEKLLNDEIRSFENILKNLEKTDEWIKKERKTEGLRVKKCKGFYYEFCTRELNRSAYYKDKIRKLKQGIEKHQAFCKKQED